MKSIDLALMMVRADLIHYDRTMLEPTADFREKKQSPIRRNNTLHSLQCAKPQMIFRLCMPASSSNLLTSADDEK